MTEDGGLQAEEDMQRVLWSPARIHQRVTELGASISCDFAHSLPLLVIGVLSLSLSLPLPASTHQIGSLISPLSENFQVATGAFMFVADLVRKISLPVAVEFIRVQSYGSKTESSGVALMADELKMDINGKHVLVVEDIIDTGTTLARLVPYLSEKGAASVSVCALLDKVSRRKSPLQLPPDSRFYRGFECPDDFVVGYGMDFAEQYRSLPYIGVLKPSKYNSVYDQ